MKNHFSNNMNILKNNSDDRIPESLKSLDDTIKKETSKIKYRICNICGHRLADLNPKEICFRHDYPPSNFSKTKPLCHGTSLDRNFNFTLAQEVGRLR